MTTPLELTADPGTHQPAPESAHTLRVRRTVPIQWLPIVAVAGVVYAVLAWQNPIIGRSVVAVQLLTILFMCVLGFLWLNRNADRLDAFRVQSLYWLVCFCVAPLFVLDPVWHFQGDQSVLIAKAATFALAAYLMIAVGYYLPIFRPLPAQIEFQHTRFNRMNAAALALVLLGIGFLSYGFLFIKAGGLARMLGGDEARNQFFKGFGVLYWSSLFCYAGSVLYFASLAAGRRRPWIHAWPLGLTFACFLLLQGRGRALNALILAVLVGHYLIRPLRLPRLALFGFAGFSLAVFVGVARDPDVRFILTHDPVGLVTQVAGDFWDAAQITMANSFSRLRQLMLIFDKVPDWMPRDWGGSLLAFLNPPLRLVGLEHLQTPTIGPRLFKIAHPEHLTDLPTGYLPSIIGEFLVNFPWYLALLPCVVYGATLRLVYDRLMLRGADVGSVALYVVLMLYFNNMIISAFGQNVFEILTLVIPISIINWLSRRGSAWAPLQGFADQPNPARP